MEQRLKYFYQEKVTPTLRKQFHYKNSHQIPGLEKIVISQGVSKATQNSKAFESLMLEVATITTQFIKVNRVGKSIASFKIRKKISVGLRVTLRGEHMYAFFDRIINLVLPRIRDFRGVKRKSFDGRGNYSFGFSESWIFPEIRYDQRHQSRGIYISIITTSYTDEERFTMLITIGIPFRNI